jgi:sugar/nucleoside kinase (ribokinase family)
MAIDVAGMGNALMDALAIVADDALIADLGLSRGMMQLVDHDRWMEIYERVRLLKDPEFHSGGSCANTISAIGWLGGSAVYHGQVGDDQMGHLYGRLLEKACGRHALKFTRAAPTGKCLAIISSRDAERTMCTDLGAATTLTGYDGFASIMAHAKVTHFEGYALFSDEFRKTLVEVMRHVRLGPGLVSIDACDPSVVVAFPDLFWSILDDYAHLCFLNEEEALRLTGKSDPEEALREVMRHGSLQVVVVKLGAQGSLVGAGGEVWRIPVREVPAVDTTGAGDAYAGAFLYGFTRGWTPDRCGRLASAVAGLTVSQVGAVVQDRAKMAEAIASVS